jgi:hypothetical protein
VQWINGRLRSETDYFGMIATPRRSSGQLALERSRFPKTPESLFPDRQSRAQLLDIQ